MKKVAIVGGGASGLICAIFCAKNGFDVTIFEQNDRCGKKLLVTGNGRCNITNSSQNSSDFYSKDSSFVEQIISRFDYSDQKRFFESIGIYFTKKDENKIYPITNEAKTVQNNLVLTSLNLGVKIVENHLVESIKKLQNEYDFVVVATGSPAADHLVASSSVIDFAKEFGIKTSPFFPSLVQLEVKNSNFCKRVSGVKIDSEISLYIDEKLMAKTSGDLLFTSYGLSGFAVLDISHIASQNLQAKKDVVLSIDLLKDLTEKEIIKNLQNLINSGFSVYNALSSLINQKLAKEILFLLKINTQINSDQLNKIAQTLKNLRFVITDTHGFRHAEVCGGGVDLSELNSHTLEAKKCKNLYFCGEAIDVTGKRGGFNLSFAWAGGFVVSEAIKGASLQMTAAPR